MKAYAAELLVDSIGINHHSNYPDSVYARFDDLVLPRLKELGVRHLRSLAIKSDASWYYDRLKKLTDAGLVHLLGMGQKNQYQKTDDDPALLPGVVERIGGLKAVSGIEGSNEPDISGVSDWPTQTIAYQKRLYGYVKSHSTLKSLPVASPSITGNEDKVRGGFSDCCDLLNIHAYSGGENQPSVSFTANGARKEQMAPGKPRIITELGYHDARNKDWGQQPATPEAIAAYVPIIFLEAFMRGVVRTYLYELLDLWPDPELKKQESNWGLIENDGTPKPSFYALKRLIALHTDSGKPFMPRDLDVKLTGPESVRSVLYQKSDGSYLLDLWRDVKFGAKPVEVTVKLPKAIAGYKLHPFDGQSVSVTPGKTASRQVIDITTTLDKATLEPLYTKRSERTEVVGTGGADVIPVSLGSSLVTLEFAA